MAAEPYKNEGIGINFDEKEKIYQFPRYFLLSPGVKRSIIE